MISRRTLLASGLALSAGVATGARAQAYPDKPIRMIVPFPPGGPIDTMARLAGKFITDSLGQQVVVENRPGAGSTIGSKAAAAAPPDGYTLMFGSSGSLATAPSLYVNAGIDPLKMFAPVSTFALLPHLMVVSEQVPAKTVAEFVAYAKANPGVLNSATQGIGTTSHLTSELFQQMAGVKFQHIHYRGSAPAVQDLVAGNVDVAFDNIGAAGALIRAGTIRALGLATEKPRASLPGVPTV
jgi:tripartite-type tricarboxylate transporter receptor subunit TctC